MACPGPRIGKVELTVDHRVPTPTRVGQVNGDLGILDPPGGAGVLALHPHGVHALLEVTGLVDHQDPVRVAECAHDVVAQVVANAVGVPARPSKQVLHAMRIAVSGVLGDTPAVLPRKVSQQAEQEAPHAAAGLHPREPPRHPTEQPVGLGRPIDSLYAVAHGHRLIHSRPHNRAGSVGGRPTSGTATPEDHDLQLEVCHEHGK